MTEDGRSQIILGRLMLATAGYKIDVKKVRLTFDVGEHHAEFGLFKDLEYSLSTLPCCGCELAISDKPMRLIDMTPHDPTIVDYILFEGQGLDSVKVDTLPLSIVKDEPHTVDGGYLGYCCRFMTLLLSMPPLGGVEHDFDMEIDIDFCEG